MTPNKLVRRVCFDEPVDVIPWAIDTTVANGFLT